MFDAFRGQLTIQQLEALCDDYSHLNTKGGSYMKEKKPMVVVFSNFSIEDCYHKALLTDDQSLEPLYVRFHEKELTKVYVPLHVGQKRTVFQALMPEVIQCKPQRMRQ